MKIGLFPWLPVDQNWNSSSCNQVRSPWLFVQNVIKFQHTTIHRCLRCSIIDSLIICSNVQIVVAWIGRRRIKWTLSEDHVSPVNSSNTMQWYNTCIEELFFLGKSQNYAFIFKKKISTILWPNNWFYP